MAALTGNADGLAQLQYSCFIVARGDSNTVIARILSEGFRPSNRIAGRTKNKLDPVGENLNFLLILCPRCHRKLVPNSRLRFRIIGEDKFVDLFV